MKDIRRVAEYLVVRSVDIDSVVSYQHVASSDQFQSNFTLAHGAFAGNQHAMAIHFQQYPVHAIDRSEEFLQIA